MENKLKASQGEAEQQGKHGGEGETHQSREHWVSSIFHVVKRQMEHGLGSFWRSVLQIINKGEGDRETGQKAKVTKAKRAFWIKALPQFCSWNFFPSEWKVN